LNEIFITHFKTPGPFLSVCIATLRSVVQSVVRTMPPWPFDIIRYERLLTTSGGKNFTAW
jgi:hypothetical protein